MKKLIAMLALGAMTATGANAQAVLGYTVSETSVPFTAVSGATTVFDGSEAEIDSFDFPRTIYHPAGTCEAWGDPVQGYDLGFDMNVGGKTYRNFLISTEGYVYLGNGAIGYNTYMAGNMLTYGTDFTIVGMASPDGLSYGDDTRISYAAAGTGCMVVEYRNIMYKDSDNGVYTPVTFQLMLYADGTVTIVTDAVSGLAGGQSVSAIAGVRQYGDFVAANGTVGSLSAGVNKNESMKIVNGASRGITFNTPGDCVTPLNQPTELKLDATTDKIEGEFLGCDGADTYLVVYAEAGKSAETPVDGTNYVEDDVLGGGKVAYYGPDTEFEVYSLSGSTQYDFTVYAVGSYGLSGPKYNTVNPLKVSVTTAPNPVEEVVYGDATTTSFSMTVTPNEQNDDIVVLYNDYCFRDNHGDHGLFGEIPADVRAGDVLPAPADFTPPFAIEGAPMPANAGTVAYVGKAGGKITIGNLDPSTLYFVGVYTRSADGVVTTEPLYSGWSTTVENPYDGDSYQFPRYSLNYGWQTGEGAAFRNEEYRDRATGLASQGTQIMQPALKSLRGNAVTGAEAWVAPQPVYVNDRHMMAQFDYCVQISQSRFSTLPFNDWSEDDVIELQVSEDNGETWTALAAYTADSHPNLETVTSYASIRADLNEYRGKTILVRWYFKSFTVPGGFGFNLFIDRFSVKQADFPAVPEVTVGGITDSRATVSWISKQTDYQLAYKVKDGDATTIVDVKNARSHTLAELKAETTYEVWVRGVLVDAETGGQTGYSEWSDPVEFTTAGYPAVDAPEGLKTDDRTLADLGYVIVSWDKVSEAEEYEVAYRRSDSTEWTCVRTTDCRTMLTGLDAGATYIWKVRAYCTHDRVTSYSAQERFVAPTPLGVDGIGAEGVRVKAGRGAITVDGASRVTIYSASGTRVAEGMNLGEYKVAAGIYVVAADGRTCRVMVR